MSELFPKLVFTKDGKYVIRDSKMPNLFIKPSEVKLIIQGLEDYCRTYTDNDISKINKEIIDNFDSPQYHSIKRRH